MKDTAFKLFPFVAFAAFLVKCLIMAPTVADSVIFCALVAYIILDSLRLTDKRNEEMQKKLTTYEQQLIEMKNDIRNVQNNVNGVKLGMGIRQMSAPLPPKNG